ncbi:MAG: MgtC/SapB family protein [Phycisphaerales bacterium]
MPPETLSEFATPLSAGTVAVRLGLAVLFGAIVGFERKIADKPADVRTMVLISAGAAGFALMGVQISAGSAGVPGLTPDPTRVVSYIISGVGFLGAGAILHSKKTIKGMTTAAAIWAGAAIGAACGLGLYTIASGLFVTVFAMLWVPWTAHLVGLDWGEDDGEDVERPPRVVNTAHDSTPEPAPDRGDRLRRPAGAP